LRKLFYKYPVLSIKLLSIIIFLSLSTLVFAAAPLPAPSATGTVTGLPLPRYASLKAKEVNVRTGPGKRYPIDWVMVRENMPVEIIGEYDTWRKIRDWEGTEGWVHHAMLSGRRTVLVIKNGFTLRKDKSFDAAAVVKVQPMVAGELETCTGGWCKVNVTGFEGWIQHEYIWGVRTEEVF
jgi:SH3-like domain-containing protein